MTDGSDVIVGAALLIAGRFLAAVFAGPEAVDELVERAVVGLVLYFSVAALVFWLPEVLLYRYGYRPGYPAAMFCAAYFFLLALAEAAQIYLFAPEPAPGRAEVRLFHSRALKLQSLKLRFAGDGLEILRIETLRPAGRIAGFVFGMIFVCFGGGAIVLGGFHLAVVLAFIPLAMGGAIVLNCLRGGSRAWIIHARPGELAMVETRNGKLRKLETFASANLAPAEGVRIEEPLSFAVWVPGRDKLLPVAYVPWLESEARAASLARLLNLHLTGDRSPQGLREAVKADPGLVLLLGAETVGRLMAATPRQRNGDSLACPDCAHKVAASAPRCPYCGVLYPSL